jgi:DNA-directed RNA polymerase specialized sigma24 family protein
MRGPVTTSASAARERLRRSIELRTPLPGRARSARTPSPGTPIEGQYSAAALARAVGADAVRRYEAALAQLRPRDREAVVGRIELQWSYEELAEAFGVASPEAARSIVTRALARLIQELSE